MPTAAARDLRLERRTRLAGLVAGPLAAGILYLVPLPALPPAAHTLAAILCWVVLYWVTRPIPLPVTALLGTTACVLLGLGSAKTVFAPYAHPIIFLLLGSFFLAEALAVHGVDRRFATWMLSRSWIAARPARILFAVGAMTAVISMWISNTAATALMLPAALGVCAALRAQQTDGLEDWRTALMLILSYGATAGGLATIIGTPTNLIGIGLIGEQTGVRLSFLTWMTVGLPLALFLLLIAWTLLLVTHPPRLPRLPNLAGHLRAQRHSLGPWTRGQINACVVFGAAVLLWIGPGLIAAIQGPDSALSIWLDRHLPNELVALLAAGLLFVLPASRWTEPTLSWQQAAKIDWGTVLLFGGGLAFGDLMVKTGLAESVGRGFVDWAGMSTVWSLTAVSIGVAVLISELTSNAATAGIAVPLAIGIAQSAGVSPVPPALGACLGASLGFALPVSTPPNAIVYGTGLIPMRSMIRTGLLFDLLGAMLIWLALRLLCPLLGLSE